MEDKESDDDGLTTVYNPHQKPVLCVKVSGGYLYSCSSDKSVRVYNMEKTRQEKEFKTHKRSITCIEIFTCCQEDYIISGSTDKHIIMYHAKTGVVEIDFSLGARIQCMVTQGSLLVAGLSNGFIHLIDLQTKSALGRWLVGDDPVRKDISCLAIHNNRLLTASYDNKISCWDISHYVGGCGGGSILARIHQISSFSDMVLCMQV
ncbi:Zinc finger protein 106 [Geodia barretti]|nr:Zinc finger protein 106 [Geodia barretti]